MSKTIGRYISGQGRDGKQDWLARTHDEHRSAR